MSHYFKQQHYQTNPSKPLLTEQPHQVTAEEQNIKSLKNLQNKLKYTEKELFEQRHYTKDLEKSLKINKELVMSLIQDNMQESTLQSQMKQIIQENTELLSRIKSANEDIKVQNSKILLLEQINHELKMKEKSLENIQMNQIVEIKNQIERKNTQVQLTEKSFYELFTFTSSKILKNDRKNQKYLQEILQTKLEHEKLHLNDNTQSFKTLLNENQKFHKDLSAAQKEIQNLKSMLAQTTIKTLYTEEGYDCEGQANISVNYGFLNNDGRAFTEIDVEPSNNLTQMVPDFDNNQTMMISGGTGAAHNNNNATKDLGNMGLKRSRSNVLGRLKKPPNKVPNLNLSSLKNVQDYKHWYEYSIKLEDVVKQLREQIKSMEEEIDDLQAQVKLLKIPNKEDTSFGLD
eukprot:403353660